MRLSLFFTVFFAIFLRTDSVCVFKEAVKIGRLLEAYSVFCADIHQPFAPLFGQKVRYVNRADVFVTVKDRVHYIEKPERAISE